MLLSCAAIGSRLASSSARAGKALRPLLLFAGLAALSACATVRPQVDNRVEAQHYAALAKSDYTAPGPPEDPWGPYVAEASSRYDVPQSWIRSVMRQESGGQQYRGGILTISDKGAMGLMQVEPETYDELRGRYSLGDDPYNPHDNILAGAAFLREMYDLYGSPGFLAAYNCGPGRLDKYLAGSATLPDQTRHYVAAIGPSIQGDWPANRSAAESLALNQLPLNIPAGLRYGNPYGYASRRHGRGEVQYASRSSPRSSHNHGATRYAAAQPRVTTVAYHGHALVQPAYQLAMATPRGSHGFRLISSASAEVLPLRRGASSTGNWAVQVGAFGNQGQAAQAAASAGIAGHRTVGTVRQAHATLYRARVVGLSREAAVAACSHAHRSCVVLSPGSQS